MNLVELEFNESLSLVPPHTGAFSQRIGNKLFEGSLIENKKDGIWTIVDDEHPRQTECVYKNGKLVNKMIKYESASSYFEYRENEIYFEYYKNGMRTVVESMIDTTTGRRIYNHLTKKTRETSNETGFINEIHYDF